MHETVVEQRQCPASPEASWGGGDVPMTPKISHLQQVTGEKLICFDSKTYSCNKLCPASYPSTTLPSRGIPKDFLFHALRNINSWGE